MPTFGLVLTELKRRYPKLIDGVVESIDEDVAAELAKAGFSPGGTGYDPLDLTRVSAAARELLTRAFSRRSDLLDLNSRALRRALEFRRYRDSADADLAESLATVSKTQADILAAAHVRARDAFKRQGTAEGDGFSEQASGIALANTESSGLEGTRDTAIRSRHKAATDFEDALQAVHTRDNSPLNYVQRMQRLRRVYVQDLMDAAEAITAFRNGQVLLGHPHAVPPGEPGDAAYIYALSDQLRECVRLMDQSEVGLTEFTKVVVVGFAGKPGPGPVPFAHARFLNADGSDVQYSAASTYIGNGVLRFNVPASVTAGLADVRIKAVGCRLGFKTPYEIIDDTTANAALLAKLPRQRLKASPAMLGCELSPPRLPGDVLPRAAVRVGQVPLVDGGNTFDPVYECGPNVESRAVTGRWEVSLDQFVLTPERARGRECISGAFDNLPATVFQWNGFAVKYLYLFLRISGRPAPTPAGPRAGS